MRSNWFANSSYLLASDFGLTWQAQASAASSSTCPVLAIAHTAAQTAVIERGRPSRASSETKSVVCSASHSFGSS